MSERAARGFPTCAKCQHCEQQRSLLGTREFCASPQVVDLVTGKAIRDARTMRTQFSVCGPEGKLFSPRTVPVAQQTLIRWDWQRVRALFARDAA